MSVKYTYVRHPLCAGWVLTVARKWDNEEKTALRISWCANKTECSAEFEHLYEGVSFAFNTLDRFDKRRARLICDARLNNPKTYTVMQLDAPHKHGESPPLVPRIVEFVSTHEAVPSQLRKLLKAAKIANYKVLPMRNRSVITVLDQVRLLADKP